MYRFPRRFRWFRWTVILVGLYGLVGFFALPPLIRTQLPKRLSVELGRTVTIGSVRVNPFALSATLENVNITERDRRGSFVSWKRLYVNADPLASLFGEWVIGAIELDGFQGNVAVGADGGLNFSDLLADAKGDSADARGGAKEHRPVRIGRLQVTRAQVSVRDESRRQEFTTLVGPVTFLVTGFRTGGRADSPYAFEATTEAGEKIAWRGTLTTAPFRSSGEFHLDDVLLPKYAPYYSASLGAVVEDGRVSVGGKYEADFGAGERKLAIAGATVAVRDLRIVEPGATEPMLALPKVDATEIDADALARRVDIARLAVAGGSVSVRREADGKLSWERVWTPAQLTVQPGGASVARGATTGASVDRDRTPDVRAQAIAITGLKVHATDRTLPRPADVTLNALKLNVKNFSLAEGSPMPLQMGFDWAPEGAVQIDGTVTLKPSLAANVVVVATKMALAPMSPYLEQHFNARIAAGTLSTQSRVQINSGGTGPAVNVGGDASLTGFKLTEGTEGAPVAGWTDLALEKFSASTSEPLTVAVDEVKLAGPTANLVRRADGTWNVAGLRRATAQTPETTSAATPSILLPGMSAGSGGAAEPEPKISIGRVTINEGEFAFTDQSIKPAVRMALTQFGGVVTGLSSEHGAKANLDLSARVDGSGPVKVTGQVDPLGREKSAALNVDLRNVDLVPLSPYAAKFAGYEVARGKLQVDVTFHLKDAALNSADVITLDQFTWGAASDSPAATKLPVRLGVALLKDREGKIVLDVPVEGNVDDPNFRVSRVVWHAIGNVLTKAATSPFALLGSMFGGGGDELSWQDFAAGSSELQAGEEKKLATMVKALTERPGLSVAIEGGYDAGVDRPALQEQKWKEQLRAQVQRLRGSTAASAPRGEPLAATGEERAEAVKALYARTFPGGVEVPMSSPDEAAERTAENADAAPAAKSAPPAAKKSGNIGLVERTWGFLTSWRKRREEKHEEKLAAAAAEQRRREAERDAQKEADAAAAARGERGGVIGLPIADMEARLKQRVQVTPDDLRALAEARARAVRDYFTQAGIAGERVLLTSAGQSAPEQAAPRATLSLQ
ncbi:DUF748 domain-containing protein [Horticoccus luteus]|uniref:DUF748 domain-containing protein n=1 Tax=Horticoccus luteus TaxID=2862869 RepID=A0A8F9TX75_9BACT|nr:DUF748 domain-containing protein [Horticoccus luteus]QYM79692.1 DUF748 domain-containing protein [Horticoccus luteus]